MIRRLVWAAALTFAVSLLITGSAVGVAPVVTITSPTESEFVNHATPTIEGSASDTSDVTVEIWAGTDTTGVPLATQTATPDLAGDWSLDLATTLVDGPYTLIASQTDATPTTGESAPRGFTVDITAPTGSITAPTAGAVVDGLTAISSDSADTSSGVQQVVFERSPANAGTWTTIGTDLTAPYSVDWATGSVADGSYDLHAVTTDVAGNPQTSVTVNVVVDNNKNPSVSLTAPAGSVNAAAPDPFTVTATSPDPDIVEVEFFRCSGASIGCGSDSWVSLGTDTTSPYEAQWNVDGDGNRALRAVATDLGSNIAMDTDDVTIDTVAPVSGLDDPGTPRRGTISLTGSGSDPGGTGVASLAFQRSPAGAATWVTIGTDTSSPYSASFDTTLVSDGLYDLRTVATDQAGNSTASPLITSRRIDNTAPTHVELWTARPLEHRVVITWNNPSDSDFLRVIVRRGTAVVYQGRAESLDDRGLYNGTVYTYRFTAVDTAGNVSTVTSVRVKPRGKLFRPRDGGVIRVAPVLEWARVPRATYYNVQLWRNGRKILSRWPTRPSYELRMRWRFGGHVRTLRDGTYLWYVWPGFGDRERGRYGRMLGSATFFKR
jgi:hypothetical protein